MSRKPTTEFNMRKSVFDKDTTFRLEEMAREDYWNGPGWGEATSRDFQITQYLSEELNKKLLSRLEEVRQVWKAKLDAIPKAKRFDKSGLPCQELENGEYLFRDKKDTEVMEVNGHMVYARSIKSGRFQNGRRWAEVVDSPEKMIVDFGYWVNSRPANIYGGSVPENNIRIYWDAGKKRFYTVIFKRCHTEPIEPSQHKKNWARETKRNEFVRKFMSLAKEVVQECGNIKISNGRISAEKQTELF